jgi:hypothetical protein
MIEQQNNQLLISFPTPELAASFKVYLETLLALVKVVPSLLEPETSDPPSDPSLVTPASPEPNRSHHTVLTDERLEALSKQREQGLTQHQRLLKAQTTLRDGTLPFRALEQPPQPSGQASPRQKAQQEGGFADGAALPEAGRRKGSQLRPVLSPKPSQS